jgi:hypothetical protein
MAKRLGGHFHFWRGDLQVLDREIKSLPEQQKLMHPLPGRRIICQRAIAKSGKNLLGGW